jgi:hypothetical protein
MYKPRAIEVTLMSRQVLEMKQQTIHQRSRIISKSRMYYHACLFIDDYDVVVLKDYIERKIFSN